MRWFVRVPLLAAMLAAALWSPLRSAAEDDAPSAPQVTDEQRRRVASHATHIAKALGQSAIESGLGGGPKAPKAGKRVVATHQSAKQSLDAAAPPPVMADIAEEPPLWQKMLDGWNIKRFSAASWLRQVPTRDDSNRALEAFDYLKQHTTAGQALGEDLRPVPPDDTDMALPQHGVTIFADTGGAYGVTVPLLHGAGSTQHLEHWRLVINSALRDAPVEVRALVLGHELGVHAVDVDDEFIKNPGSQIPSELRAMVLEAKNYLEIRKWLEENNPDRLAALRNDAVWARSDIKARIVLSRPVPPHGYPSVLDEALKFDLSIMTENPGGDGLTVARDYISKKYARSGETGMENLDLLDDSPVGKYNAETKATIDSLKISDYPFMDHDY